jgi:Putative Actinobacterial Holin-X, holin superfamily III
MDHRRERSIPEVLTNLLGQYVTLFRTESQLARAEISDKVSQVGTGLALIVGGSVLVTPGLVVLLGAAVAALQDAGLAPPWAAALAVGGGVLLIGLILLLVGLNMLKAEKLVPTKTINQFQQDAAMAKQQVRRIDEQQRAA